MRTVQETVFVEAKPEAVWEVLEDPYYIPKLYPDLLNVSVDPPGKAVVGQLRTMGARAGKRTIEIRTRVVSLTPGKRFELAGRDGGALDEFSQVMELIPQKGGTVMKATFRLKVSENYFGPGFDLLTLEQMAVRNQEEYLKNVKSLAELTPVV